MNTTIPSKSCRRLRLRLRRLSTRLRLPVRSVTWALLEDLTQQALTDRTLREGIRERIAGEAE